MMSENLLLLASLLVFVAILVTKVGSKLGAPSLLFFLLLGMAVGTDGLGFHFEDYGLAESIGHFAMTIILFSAGMETSLAETKPVFRQGVLLSTVGVLITVVLTGVFIKLVPGEIAGDRMMACFLLAAVMGSTDSASVFSVLREKKLRLRENLGPLVELESGSNDPIAYMLTITIVSYIAGENVHFGSGWGMVLSGILVLLLQIVVGLALGFALGYATKWLLDKVHFPGFALTSILILSIGFFTNGLATLLHGNGLLAIYVAAIIIGNKANLKQKKEIQHFYDGLTWLMQLVMFLILGLLARPSQMLPVLLPAVLIGAFMLLVARPASVFLCLLPFRKMSFRAKTFISWVGLKGAGPILFALCPVVAGLEGASDMFNIVFIITLFSLLIQGGSLGRTAKWLKLSYEEEPKAETFGMEVPEEMGMMRDHVVTEEDLAEGSTLRDMHLPHGIRVMMVRREERFLVPHGSMRLEPGDHLVIIIGESDD
ncbi:MAG: potassium/proton antiporter [Bacteroidales bacterium]|nr:potassium/proton antiporter [Bacteroidales bacterium]